MPNTSKNTEMGFSACIGGFVFWMNAMFGASAVKYNCKGFSARMISLYDLQCTIKLQRQSLALLYEYVCPPTCVQVVIWIITASQFMCNLDHYYLSLW